jgi:hypothetical protein
MSTLDLSNLPAQAVEGIEDAVNEYGYTKTINIFNDLGYCGLAQFTFGLYLMQYYTFNRFGVYS